MKFHRSSSEEGVVKQSGAHHYNRKNNSLRFCMEKNVPASLVMNCCKSKLHKTKLEALTFHTATVFLLLCGALISAPVCENKRSAQENYFDIQQKTAWGGLFCELLKLRSYPLFNESAFSPRSGKSNMSRSFNISHDSMSNELLRLYTLSNFPRDINISLIRLAAAGFYHTEHLAETKCYSCGVIYSDWHSFDTPLAVHRLISPSCNVVKNDMSRIPPSDRHFPHPSCSTSSNNSVTTKDCISATDSYISRISPPIENSVQSPRLSAAGNGRLPIMEGLLSSLDKTNERNPTSSDSNVTSSLSRNIMSSLSGRHDVDTDTASESQINNIFIQTNNLPVSNITKHKDNFRKENPGASGGISQNTCSGNSPGVNMEPRYPNYEPNQVRVSSFQGWPSYLDQTSREMANAGWFYAGYNDYTRCFHCGGGLRNWEAGDDPWVEHTRWFPKCGFLRKNKDDRFINEVLRRQELESQRISSAQNPQAHSASNAASDNKNNRLLQNAAARSVLQMGFSNEQVLDAIHKISYSSGGNNKKTIAATDIMNILFGEDQNIQGAVGEDRRTENQIPTQSSGTHNDNDTQSLIEENRQLREQRLCKVCLDFEATIAFLPCGHIVCCKDCAPAMRKCPICRAFVKGTVKTFLS